jgi:hypothetical protein
VDGKGKKEAVGLGKGTKNGAVVPENEASKGGIKLLQTKSHYSE